MCRLRTSLPLAIFSIISLFKIVQKYSEKIILIAKFILQITTCTMHFERWAFLLHCHGLSQKVIMSNPIGAAFWSARINFLEIDTRAPRAIMKHRQKTRLLLDAQPDRQSSHLIRRLLLRLAQEPFVHFIVLGALIFAAYAMFNPQNAGSDHRIEVSTADLERLRETAIKQWGKEPDGQQLSDLVQSYVREEVLYREALASGLDKDDVIVRRRLAQKMEFLAHNEVRTPNETELREYLVSHPAQFLQAASVDFEQLYFNNNQHSGSAVEKAQKARQALLRGAVVRGDNFMLAGNYVAQEHLRLSRDFGTPFAEAVFALPVGAWSAPIKSVYGIHLVRLVQRRVQAPAHFEDIRDKLASEMLNQRIVAARDSAYARLLARYRVVLPEPSASALPTVKP